MNHSTRRIAIAATTLAIVTASPARADEVFVGVYAHEVDTPFSLRTYEDGTDFQLGYRTDRIDGLAAIGRPSAHVFASVNSAGDTSFAAVGLNWKIDVGRFYVRPGIGLAVHDAPDVRVNPEGTKRTDFGSRILFEPEIGIGYTLSERASIEASWVHISNAGILDSQQNPGLDTIGARVNYRF